MPEVLTTEANGKANNNVGALPWPDCPVVDFSLLSSPSADVAAEELEKLRSALISWGSFQLVNHEMANSFLDQVRDVTKEFFHLPAEEKAKYSKGANDSEGYINNIVPSVPQNWNDFLNLTVYPKKQRKLQVWPENPPAFRDILDEFTVGVEDLYKKLLQYMAQCLGFNITEGGSDEIIARINFSPPCPFPGLVLGSKAHSDPSTLTISLQDKETEGLQIQKDGIWYRLPVMPHAILVKFGDQIEIMSNGKVKGTVHRVVANSESERVSLALFCTTVFKQKMGQWSD